MTSLDPLYSIGSQLIEPIRRHRGLSARGGARRRRSSCCELVQIPDPERRMKSYPHEMSGGQRQRVMIAMALANDPDILIADEPTTALDVTIQAQILMLLAELQQRLGMAIVFITHDLGIVRRIADRVYVMRSGEVVEDGDDRRRSSPARSIPIRSMLLAAEPTGRKAPPPPSAPVLLEGTQRRGRPSSSAAAFWPAQPLMLRAVDRVSICAAAGPDHRHRRRIRLGQVDARPRAAAAAAERRRHPFRRPRHLRRRPRRRCGRCGANCRSSSRIRSARCRRA